MKQQLTENLSEIKQEKKILKNSILKLEKLCQTQQKSYGVNLGDKRIYKLALDSNSKLLKLYMDYEFALKNFMNSRLKLMT